jgi:hypothetical protein
MFHQSPVEIVVHPLIEILQIHEILLKMIKIQNLNLSQIFYQIIFSY